MNERKKNLPKRLLSMTLALSMCAGLSCTTAFAAGGDQGDPNSDYVYVYINVKPSTVETGTAEATPKFDGNTDEITKAESAVTEAKESFTEGETAPKFDSSKQDALDKAQTDVKDKLNDLETAKPEYKDATATEGEGNIQDDTNSDSQGDAQNVGENSGESTTGETGSPDVPDETEPPETKPSFADEVNGKVDDLNQAQTDTEKQVTDAGTVAGSKLNAVEQAKAALDQKLSEARTELESKKTEANTKVKEAEDAVKACDAKKAELDADLEKQIAELGEKPPEEAPVLQEGQNYDEYSALYDAWKTQCETYNEAVEAIQKAYDANVEVLKAENAKAEAAVGAAQAALKAAQEQLETFNTQSQEGFNNLNKDFADNFAALKAYNDALKAYNDAVKSYNDAASEYNTAAGDYETAVEEFNAAAEKHNQAAETYNGKVTTYTDAVTAYEKAVDDYNAKVDTFNKDSATWNNQQTNAAKGKVDISSQLKDVTEGDIKVYQEVSSMVNNTDSSKSGANPIAALDAEKVAQYNKVVDAYNAAVKDWNANAVTNMLNSVQSYFEKQDPHGQKESNNLWYTVGKISIKDIFSGTPDELRNTYFNESHSDYESPAGADYNGRDLYYFDKTGEAELVGLKQGAQESNLYAQGKSFSNLLTALDKGNLEKYGNRGDSTFDPAKDINKWVLKAGYNGADNYNEVASNRSAWHLDGYLYVEQLATLARLELQAEKKEYAEKDKAVTVKPVADTTPVTEAELYDTHWGVLEPNYTPDTESWADAPTVNPFTGRDLDTAVPAPIDITDKTPAPSTGGGGGNPGGGSNPGGGGNDNPPVDIPEEDPPLVDVPEEDPPLVDIPEEEPPLVDAPEEDPVLDIPEEEPPLVAPPATVVITETKTPLVKAPAGVDIVDEAVPLADVPKTGDNTALWIAMALASVSALAVLAPRKKENG